MTDQAVAPSPRKRVLMIASAFPPTGGPGVQRSAKFAKYLPQCGWGPVVVAANGDADLPRDESLLADLPAGLPVHRLTGCDPRPALRALRRSAGPLAGKLAWRGERLINRLLAGMYPDRLVCWALRAFPRCRRLIDAHDVAVIYSTYSPASNHLLGWWLHAATGLPWVADFRDLWTDDYGYAPASRWRYWLDRALESAVLARADAVIAVSPGQRDLLAARVPQASAKFVTITNGFDASDLGPLPIPNEAPPPPPREGAFTLTFTGSFLSDRVSNELIGGLAGFSRWCESQGSAFTLRIVGTIAANLHQRLAESNVKVATTGYLPHAAAVAEMRAADALLLIVPEGRNAGTLIPGKLFEYLASARPIVLVAPRGPCDAADILAASNAGIRAAHSASDIEGALASLCPVRPTAASRHDRKAAATAPYTRRSLTRQLARLLDQVHTRQLQPQPPTP
jgi:glycosyltransferase involved in cell wall biosynthesis